jgi:hypothetical protein
LPLDFKEVCGPPLGAPMTMKIVQIWTKKEDMEFGNNVWFDKLSV